MKKKPEPKFQIGTSEPAEKEEGSLDLKGKIENLPKAQQKEILKILQKAQLPTPESKGIQMPQQEEQEEEQEEQENYQEEETKEQEKEQKEETKEMPENMKNVIMEMRELHDEGYYRYHQLAILSEINENLNGIGKVLSKMGEVLAKGESEEDEEEENEDEE